MRLKKKQIKLLIGLVIAFLAFLSRPQTPPKVVQVSPSPTAQILSATSEAQRVIVAKVVDGDTIRLNTGQTVRYIGIDTPETKHPTKGKQCFGTEAHKKNEELVLGKQVTLEKDVSETDRYGRLLRYVYVESLIATASSRLFVNDELVRLGYAHTISYPPDVKYQNQFLQAQEEARANLRGLWSLCRIAS